MCYYFPDDDFSQALKHAVIIEGLYFISVFYKFYRLKLLLYKI
jgi:ribonucleotide reductase beta subunit family protein with ferritin-like domain